MLIPITRPATSAVPLARVMTHLRVEGAAYEAEVEPYLAAAIAFIERRTGRILAPATFEQRNDGWCSPRALRAWPVREVVEVRYIDADGVGQILPPADWWWEPTAAGADVGVTATPALAARPGNVRIRFEAGCDPADTTGSGDDPQLALPPQALHAVLLLTGLSFEQRTPIALGTIVNQLPFSLQAILEQLRIFR